MKLKCFNCGYKFKNKKEVFRDWNNYPTCEDCLADFLYDEYMDDFYENVLDDIKKRFNNNYNKFKKDLDENYEACDKCSDKNYGIMLYLKKDLTEIDGKKYCSGCIDDLYERDRNGTI